MAKPKNQRLHDIAKRFDVSIKTVRNWQERGYNLDDEEELCRQVIAQRSRPPGADSVQRENRSEWNDLLRKLISLERVLTELRGPDEANWPWPFGEGAVLTPAEQVRVRTRKH